MNEPYALELRHVSRSFGDFTLSDLNLALPSGCIMGLVGENGAGKSTTLRLIMNTLRRDSGEIFVLGHDNTAPGFDALKEDIGVVLDEACFPSVLSVKELRKVLKYTYRQWEEDSFDALLRRFDLPEKKAFKDFSRGMKMKLSIAAALSHRPKLLLLDEATSGLDPIVRDEILEVFADFARQEDHSVLISSHIVSDLEKLCDYVAFLHKGKLEFCCEKDALLEGYGVLKCSAAIFSELDQGAVLHAEHSPYGVRAVVERNKVPAGFGLEHASLEDIILARAKGGMRS